MITGEKYGRLTIISETLAGIPYSKVNVKCDCGTIKTVRLHHVTSGKTTSCGCRCRDLSRKKFTTHGKTNHYLYHTWRGLIDRCNNPKNPRFKQYGGRGIQVCDEWVLNIDTFITDMGERPKGHQIDRIDNDKGYTKSNCKWSTPKENMRNTSMNRKLIWEGQELSISEWAEKTGINQSTIRKRIDRSGWSIGRTLTTKVQTAKEAK